MCKPSIPREFYAALKGLSPKLDVVWNAKLSQWMITEKDSRGIEHIFLCIEPWELSPTHDPFKMIRLLRRNNTHNDMRADIARDRYLKRIERESGGKSIVDETKMVMRDIGRSTGIPQVAGSAPRIGEHRAQGLVEQLQREA